MDAIIQLLIGMGTLCFFLVLGFILTWRQVVLGLKVKFLGRKGWKLIDFYGADDTVDMDVCKVDKLNQVKAFGHVFNLSTIVPSLNKDKKKRIQEEDESRKVPMKWNKHFGCQMVCVTPMSGAAIDPVDKAVNTIDPMIVDNIARESELVAMRSATRGQQTKNIIAVVTLIAAILAAVLAFMAYSGINELSPMLSGLEGSITTLINIMRGSMAI